MEHHFVCEPATCLEVQECRWPVQDNPYMFCNKTRRPGPKEAYCPEHAKLAYQPRAVTPRGNRQIGRAW